MTALPPLSMSQTKEDLVKHLGIPPETYTLMAKETDQVYKWLTRDPKHLKSNCKRDPPYDWSDILEIKKDHAMQRIADGGDMYTKYYWDLAPSTSDCVNWIAKWFLYHKFRYRDGRNRSSVRGRGHRDHQHRRQHSIQNGQYLDSAESAYARNNSPYQISSLNAKPNSQTDNPCHYADTAPADNFSSLEHWLLKKPNSKAYDPVRDEFKA